MEKIKNSWKETEFFIKDINNFFFSQLFKNSLAMTITGNEKEEIMWNSDDQTRNFNTIVLGYK